MKNKSNKSKTVPVILGDSTRKPVTFPVELDNLCNEFLEQGRLFAESFVSSINLPKKTVTKIENMILGSCSEVIAKARLYALEAK